MCIQLLELSVKYNVPSWHNFIYVNDIEKLYFLVKMTCRLKFEIIFFSFCVLDFINWIFIYYLQLIML